MKAIHLALSAHGGAGIAAARGVRALRDHGIDAEFWTADGSGTGPALRPGRWTGRRIRMDELPLHLYRRKRLFSAWSSNWLPSRLAERVNRARPDVVHLHWIGGGFMSPQEWGRFSAPVVWTLHDAWALTGGCHYPADCRGYLAECGSCPQLGSHRPRDLSRFNFREKRACLGAVAAFTSPSAWLAGLAVESGAVGANEMRVIPYGLDGDVFMPVEKAPARRALGLPEDAVVLVAGAQDLREPRKGCHLLRETMAAVSAETRRRGVLVLFGANRESLAKDWPCEVRWLGTLRDEAEIVRVYGAADLLLLPSLQDNFPNMALEAQACGCPVVGFDGGGLREIIEPGRTGRLAVEMSAVGLAGAVDGWLAEGRDRAEVAGCCRARFEREFSQQQHGRRLAALYAEVVERAGRR